MIAQSDSPTTDMKPRRAHSRALMGGTALACISAAGLLAAGVLGTPALAQDATWLANPGSAVYEHDPNWNPVGAPVGVGSTAIFGQSSVTNLTLTTDVLVDAWVLNPDAHNYTLTSTHQIVFLGGGIVVSGGGIQIVNDPGGELQFRNESSAGDAAIDNDAMLLFTHDSSAGNAAIANTGDVQFYEYASAGNAAIVNAGNLGFYDHATAGDAVITIAFPTGSAFFNDFSTAGNATIVNDSFLMFADDSSAADATIVNNESFLFADDSSAGNARITNNGIADFHHDSSAGNAVILNNADLRFFVNSSAADALIANFGLLEFSDTSTADNARLVNAAAGIIDISGLTTVGTTAGSIEGGGTLVLGDRMLITGLNGLSTEFSGVISGVGGRLVKDGGGALTLSGLNSYTGNTIVIGGILIVNGSIASSALVNVDLGGALGGDGLVGSTLVQNGGTLAPGNSIGTLNVAGDVMFDPGSTYQVEIDGSGNADLLHATGTATINGGTVEVVPFPDFAIGTPYTILTADGGVGGGMFDDIDFGPGSLFVTPLLAYGANDVVLTISQTADFADVALTPNQIAAAGGAQSLGGGGLFSAIALLADAGEARAAFDAVSGEIHASVKTALIDDSRFVREAALDRLRRVSGGGAAPAGSRASDGVAFWGHGFGSRGRWGSDGNAAAMDRGIGGVLVGGDALVADDVRLGLMAGYNRTGFGVDDRSSSGTADTYTLGAYGGGQWGAFSLRGGAAYGWHRLDTSRTAAFTGFSDSLSAAYDARTIQAYGEAAYGHDAGNARFEPFAGLAYVNLHTDGFSEAGGAAALTSAGRTVDAAFATLGLRAETGVTLGNTQATLRGMAGWRHAFGATPASTHSFAAGGNAFTVAGVPLASDALVLETGFDVNLTPTATLGLSYDGRIGSGNADHSLRASLDVRF